jgi:hypothetical protein
MTSKTKCKCECHVPKYFKSVDKKLSSPICSECMENHKRHKDYKSFKAFVEVTNDVFRSVLK